MKVHGFLVRDDELEINGVLISELAARVGRTPFYAYDRSKLNARVEELRRALPSAIKLHYAMKANPMPAVVCHLARLVDGIDVASGGELLVALSAGARTEEISFAGPGKSEGEIRQAIASRILVNIESFREIDLLADMSEQLGIAARCAVRVNPDFELKSSGMKMGGGPKQFGVDAEQVPRLLSEIAARQLAFEGFHLFAGSQNLRPDAICEAQSKCYDLAIQLAGHSKQPVRVLNLGGGFGIPYFPGEQPLELGPIAENLHRITHRLQEDLPGAHVVIELGRYLVGEAGIYICRIVDKKVSRGQTFLVTDGGLHHHLAASGNFGQVLRKNYPVAVATRASEAPEEVANVVGPLCTPLDLLADKMPLGHAEPNDLIAVFQSGAYGMTASPHAFLSHPPPLEILV